jgi:hypothetical protein
MTATFLNISFNISFITIFFQTSCTPNSETLITPPYRITKDQGGNIENNNNNQHQAIITHDCNN